MPEIDCTGREARLRFAIGGPAAAGKTTLLRRLHASLPPSERSDIWEQALGTDRLLSFDFAPADFLPLSDFRARATLATFTGAVQPTAACARIFANLDGLLFVADSRAGRLDENANALKQLTALRSLREVPVILFYNKRDLSDAMPVPELESRLNPLRAPHHAGVATTGEGIERVLRELARLAIDAPA